VGIHANAPVSRAEAGLCTRAGAEEVRRVHRNYYHATLTGRAGTPKTWTRHQRRAQPQHRPDNTESIS